jgi:hypothetical protein
MIKKIIIYAAICSFAFAACAPIPATGGDVELATNLGSILDKRLSDEAIEIQLAREESSIRHLGSLGDKTLSDEAMEIELTLQEPEPQPTPLPAPTSEPEPTPEPTAEPFMPMVTVEDQPLDNGSVVILKVVIDVQGWVVIHADLDGAPGAVIGFSPVVAGENNLVVVLVDTDLVTSTLHAMLHIDVGTIGIFEFPGVDEPVTLDGSVVMAAFQIQ